MRPSALFAALLLAAGCASVRRSGPTPKGIAVAVPAHDKAGARRQALEAVLPLFLTPAARREKSEALEKAVFAPKKSKAFFGYQKTSKKSSGLLEVKVDALSAALQGAGLVSPPGYASGPEVVLLALGNRAVGPTPTEHYAADVLETALFGRGVQAQDADDELLKLRHPITAKNEAGTVAQAAAGGWSVLATGAAAGAARRETQSGAWRGRARYSLSIYGVGRSSEPARFVADAEALNVSSGSAVMDAIEAAAQEAAMRVEKLVEGRHAGRATIGILVTGYKDPVFLGRLVGDLRGIEGVDGAALVSWSVLDDMALLRAYAGAYTADSLAAKLLNADPALRVTAVETEDGRITISGPDFPASEDRGQEE